MGGGDLNLKKSWHPHTMRNQEKVWKAEQAKEQEEKKVNDLRKEIEEERNREDLRRIGEASGVLKIKDSDKKLEWMYKSSTELINREEYLLGRTIDKSFETLQAEEQQQQRQDSKAVGMKQPLNHVEHECIPFSIRSYRGLESTEQVDLQRKVMEDPLMLIKQREMESRRRLLENPVKLKELHRILKTEQQQKQKTTSSSSSKQSSKRHHKKSKKAKKSNKKHKKRSKSSDSDSDASSAEESSNDTDQDLDKKLAKQYQKLKGSLDKEPELCGLNLTKLLDAKYETIARQLDKATFGESREKPKTAIRRSRSASPSARHRSANGRQERRDRSRSADRRPPNDRRRNDRHNYGRSPPAHRKIRTRSRSKSHSRSPRTNNRRDQRDVDRRNRQLRSCSKDRQRPAPKPTTTKAAAGSSKQRLTEEEKEARRREMMENAAWREEDRTKIVSQHREAYAREEKQNQARDFDSEFMQKEVKKAIANQTSVGSRIRSNLNNIQRTSAAMDANFARK